MESLSSDSVYKIDMFKSLPDALLEKCAFLSVRPDTVKNLVQAMQGESGHTHTHTHTLKLGQKHTFFLQLNVLSDILQYVSFFNQSVQH